MEKFSLTALAREQLDRARAVPSGRSATTVYGGHEHALRQTVTALTAGQSLDEHENPGEAPCTSSPVGSDWSPATRRGRAHPVT
jgi:hypothetical protein